MSVPKLRSTIRTYGGSAKLAKYICVGIVQRMVLSLTIVLRWLTTTGKNFLETSNFFRSSVFAENLNQSLSGHQRQHLCACACVHLVRLHFVHNCVLSTYITQAKTSVPVRVPRFEKTNFAPKKCTGMRCLSGANTEPIFPVKPIRAKRRRGTNLSVYSIFLPIRPKTARLGEKRRNQTLRHSQRFSVLDFTGKVGLVLAPLTHLISALLGGLIRHFGLGLVQVLAPQRKCDLLRRVQTHFLTASAVCKVLGFLRYLQSLLFISDPWYGLA